MNLGFNSGIPVKQGENYLFSVYARRDTDYSETVKVTIEGLDGTIYPDIKVINSSGPFAAGSEYERGWNSAKENQSDLVDEHYFQSLEWFLGRPQSFRFRIVQPDFVVIHIPVALYDNIMAH